MARWPRQVWTSIFTYGIIFVGFPLICLLAYAWVQQESLLDLLQSYLGF